MGAVRYFGQRRVEIDRLNRSFDRVRKRLGQENQASLRPHPHLQNHSPEQWKSKKNDKNQVSTAATAAAAGRASAKGGGLKVPPAPRRLADLAAAAPLPVPPQHIRDLDNSSAHSVDPAPAGHGLNDKACAGPPVEELRQAAIMKIQQMLHVCKDEALLLQIQQMLQASSEECFDDGPSIPPGAQVRTSPELPSYGHNLRVDMAHRSHQARTAPALPTYGWPQPMMLAEYTAHKARSTPELPARHAALAQEWRHSHQEETGYSRTWGSLLSMDGVGMSRLSSKAQDRLDVSPMQSLEPDASWSQPPGTTPLQGQHPRDYTMQMPLAQQAVAAHDLMEFIKENNMQRSPPSWERHDEPGPCAFFARRDEPELGAAQKG